MPMSGNKIYHFIRSYSKKLNSISLSPQTEVEQILMCLLGVESRSLLYTGEFDINSELMAKLKFLIQERIKNRLPLQYLISSVNFYGLKFLIEFGVFIPRPETEVLLDYIINKYADKKELLIAEIGTGAGAISICLTKFLTNCKIIATDISFKAVSLAKKNAVLNKSEDGILFCQADLFDIFKQAKRFDLIVSNPPYIAEDEFSSLSEEVKTEPRQALIGGKMGYEFSLNLIEQGTKFLKPDGKIILEISERHREFYDKFLGSVFNLEFIKDLQGKDRVMTVGFQNG